MKIPIGLISRVRASEWKMKIYYKKSSAQWKCVATNISEIENFRKINKYGNNSGLKYKQKSKFWIFLCAIFFPSLFPKLIWCYFPFWWLLLLVHFMCVNNFAPNFLLPSSVLLILCVSNWNCFVASEKKWQIKWKHWEIERKRNVFVSIVCLFFALILVCICRMIKITHRTCKVQWNESMLIPY